MRGRGNVPGAWKRQTRPQGGRPRKSGAAFRIFHDVTMRSWLQGAQMQGPGEGRWEAPPPPRVGTTSPAPLSHQRVHKSTKGMDESVPERNFCRHGPPELPGSTAVLHGGRGLEPMTFADPSRAGLWLQAASAISAVTPLTQLS